MDQQLVDRDVQRMRQAEPVYHGAVCHVPCAQVCSRLNILVLPDADPVGGCDLLNTTTPPPPQIKKETLKIRRNP